MGPPFAYFANMTNPFAERVRAASALLEDIVADRGLLAQLNPEDRKRLLDSAALVYHPDAAARRQLVKATVRRRKAERVEREEQARSATGIRALRRQAVFTTPNVFPPEDFSPDDIPPTDDQSSQLERQHCYVCKQDFTELHHFYDQLCPSCAAFNFAKRTELADLRGRVALLTGGRVKIGYQAGLKLLRCGAELIVTTRFPRDSAARYAQEPVAGGTGTRSACGPGTRALAAAISAARVPAVRAELSDMSGTAKKPHPAPTSARTPRPASEFWVSSSISPSRADMDSYRRCITRASA